MFYQKSIISRTLIYFIFFNLAFYIVIFQTQNVNIFWIVNNALLNFIILSFNKKYTLKVLSLFLFTFISLIFSFLYPVIKFSSFALTIFLILSAAIQINYLFYNIEYRVYSKIILRDKFFPIKNFERFFCLRLPLVFQ